MPRCETRSDGRPNRCRPLNTGADGESHGVPISDHLAGLVILRLARTGMLKSRHSGGCAEGGKVEKVSTQFEEALVRIELHGPKLELAKRAHAEVRDVITSADSLAEWDPSPVLIGSYARHTGIYPGKDVDVFSRFEALDTSASASEVFGAVLGVLTAEYGERVQPQARSVKVQFEDAESELSVDVVPAVRHGSRWAIPSKNSALWSGSEQWLETDPERLTALSTERNRAPTVSSRGAYVPTVKLVKQTREYHLGQAKPGGLYFEILTYWSFVRDIAGDSFAVIFAATLEHIVAQLREAQVAGVLDPALERPLEPAPSATELEDAERIFAELAGKAQAALSAEDECTAAAIWREIFGENDRGWCFPIPPGCDESGAKLGPVIEVKSRGSRAAHGFG